MLPSIQPIVAMAPPMPSEPLPQGAKQCQVNVPVLVGVKVNVTVVVLAPDGTAGISTFTPRLGTLKVCAMLAFGTDVTAVPSTVSVPP